MAGILLNFKSLSAELFSATSLYKGILGILILLAALTVGLTRLDLGVMLQFLHEISAPHMLAATVAIVGVMALSTVRFAYINKKFGGNESWLFLHRVNMLSLLYSQIALPLIAQILGRISHGSEQQRIYYAPMTILEKSLALAIMIFFGGVASFTLLNQYIIPEGFVQALMIMGITFVAVITISLFLIFNPSERQHFRHTLSKISQIGVVSILLISTLIQLGILLIYTLLAMQFAPHAPLISLIGGAAIVVLATSIPIGFGGWGIREAAAAAVFFALGMPPEVGVVVGLLYGFMHLIILGLTVVLLPRAQSSRPSTKTFSNPFMNVNAWPLTFLLIMVLLPFQIRFPLASGLITLNSVDIIALMVMINFTLVEYIKGRLKFIWVDTLTWVGLATLIAMIIVGWFVGWLRFGSSEWATTNRLLGLIPVLSYLFVGVAMRRYIKPEMMAKFAVVLVLSLVATVLAKLISFNILAIQLPLYFNWSNHVNGFIADRNAFSFMAGMAAVLLVIHNTKVNNLPIMNLQTFSLILLSILMTLIIYTGSRTGLGSVAVIVLIFIITNWRALPLFAIGAVLGILIIDTFNYLQENQLNSLMFMDNRNLQSILSISESRSSTYSVGIELFQNYPIFGGGLGAGLRETGLVIHNLYLWVLGEMGLLGAVLCIPLAIAFFRTLSRRYADGTTPFLQNKEMHSFALFIMICGGFSIYQDIAYQRILWLVVGFIMARPYSSEDDQKT